MSKNAMSYIWSWDHTFNALATVYTDRELGWDQMMVVYENQAELFNGPNWEVVDRLDFWQQPAIKRTRPTQGCFQTVFAMSLFTMASPSRLSTASCSNECSIRDS